MFDSFIHRQQNQSPCSELLSGPGQEERQEKESQEGQKGRGGVKNVYKRMPNKGYSSASKRYCDTVQPVSQSKKDKKKKEKKKKKARPNLKESVRKIGWMDFQAPSSAFLRKNEEEAQVTLTTTVMMAWFHMVARSWMEMTL